MDEIKKAHKEGYAKGYAAGKKRLALEDRRLELYRKRNAFFNKALLAVTPRILSESWRFKGKLARTTDEKIEVAISVAEELTKHWRPE